MRRFEYTQNLPQQQFANYMASIYGSPLGAASAAPQMQGSSTLQNIGGLFNVAGAVPGAVKGFQTGLDFFRGLAA
jgi:predicted membrane protein